MNANKIIINADDFGYSADVNGAILRSFERHLITSTSLLANMPGFVEAVQLVKSHASLATRVGIHLNLTEGYPLSEDIRSCKRFCDADGSFLYRREYSLFFLSARERRAVYGEMEAQLERLLGVGIRPSHLDSHHHVHTEWALVQLVTRLGRRYGIRKIRLTRNMGRTPGYSKLVYKGMCNGYLRRFAGVRSTDYFGDIEDLRHLLSKRSPAGKSIEVMVHPLFDESGELVDYDRKPLYDKLRPVIDHRNTISYTDL
jgi:predicted glycoside hydrolase/deacetylase ChbG (UPF0249 family)